MSKEKQKPRLPSDLTQMMRCDVAGEIFAQVMCLKIGEFAEPDFADIADQCVRAADTLVARLNETGGA